MIRSRKLPRLAILREKEGAETVLCMLTNLALVDWVALVAAGLLLAASLAAAVLAFSVSRHRRRNMASKEAEVETPARRPLIREAQPEPDASMPRRYGNHHQRSAHLESTEIDLKPMPVWPREPEMTKSPKHAANPETDELLAEATTTREDGSVAIADRAGQLLGRATSSVSQAPIPETERPATRAPGFSEDPMGRHEQRYWDGTRWTEYVKDDGLRTVDPLQSVG